VDPWKLKAGGSELTVVEELTLLDGARAAARSLEVSLTFRCGNRCISCPLPLTGKDVPAGVVPSALKDYAQRRGRLIREMDLILTGGEPALAKGFLDAARLGLDLGFRSVSLTSSAYLFADPRLSASVLDAGIRRLFLSFHSHRPAVYDKLTGTTGRFRKAVSGIERCLSLPFEQVTCNMVLNRHNYRDVPGHARFLARLKERSGGTTPLALFLSTLEENPAWESLAVPHSKAAPFILKAAAEGAVPIRRFTGDWAFPLCVGGMAAVAPRLAPEGRRDTPAWYAPSGWDPAQDPAPQDFIRVKAQACRACPLDPVCAGLSRVYANAFGVGELSAAPRRPKARPGGRRIYAS
jgi:hypothetical protein